MYVTTITNLISDMNRLVFSLLRSWRPVKRSSLTALRWDRCKFRRYSSEDFKRIRHHLSGLLKRHSSLIDKLTNEDVRDGADREVIYRALSSLEPVVDLANQLSDKEKELQELDILSLQEQGELAEMAEKELEVCLSEVSKLQELLVDALIPVDDADSRNAVLEVRAGAGGQEAALFTDEMFHLYQRYAAFKGWEFEVLSEDVTDKGGVKYASAGLSGDGVFGSMKHESGVHRVQRIPLTEASGRIHTSTMSVVILPQPTQVEVIINASDIKIETLKASGAGGQHVNTTDSAVRLYHIPSGIVIHIQDERSQHKNRAKAMKLLRARLYERQRSEAQRERSQQRTVQIAGGERSEKIRTYNYPQDRITDHRLGSSLHGVAELMEGEGLFDELIKSLRLKEKMDAIASLTSESN